ncbi:MAG: Cro/Cl family transcriptional regulator [endosymbiont of Escarpia spicata]|uniref:Cro/Cl family transcriptional regulator n=2 Tax=sulfur-oxidizing symbionts TaxID=32036 RepID=A0A370DNA5_9GAMM|nr:MAG: Cro/Cl family transcriptional regulator [endosymbiont of Escarpia spicata]RDH91858.1 MAG: Cro/Cl family transcriptional regulator [endosymbiont of Lamellibrachia luymesi]RDH93172.1 MAG: Cro/Cl family transcriptional regulator [endosymbiont of Seepiophila jonesi]
MNNRPVLNESLAKAVDLAGGQTNLAKLIGKRQGDIWAWLFRTGVVPTEFLVPIEEAVGHKVTIRELAVGQPGDEEVELLAAANQ